jgi:hypothetical protein
MCPPYRINHRVFSLKYPGLGTPEVLYGLDPSVVGSCVTGCAPAPPLEEVLLVGEVKVVDLSANARPHVLESRR